MENIMDRMQAETNSHEASTVNATDLYGDEKNFAEFQKTLVGHLQCRNIWINLSNVVCPGSRFVNLMVWFYKQYPEGAKHVIMVGASDIALKTLKCTGLCRLYRIQENAFAQ